MKQHTKINDFARQKLAVHMYDFMRKIEDLVRNRGTGFGNLIVDPIMKKGKP